MINIDDRLLDLLPKIGADALAILLLIASRIDQENKCFPSRETLQKESGFGRDKVDKAIKNLKENNLISTSQRVREDGRLSTNTYTIRTDFLGVYVTAKNKPVTENQKPVTENQKPVTENPITVRPITVRPITVRPITENTDNLSIKQSSLSINQDLEVLNIIPVFSENCIDSFVSTNAEKANFSVSNEFLTPNNDSLKQESTLLESKSLEIKPKETGPFDSELVKAERLKKTLELGKAKTEGSCVFESYSTSYRWRYGIDPVRNAKTNALCSQLVKRLGLDEAIQTARFYVEHNDAFYVRSGHSLDLLVRDAEKLRTECLTGIKTTMASSQKIDKEQEKRDFWQKMMDKARLRDEQKEKEAI